jgi:Protein of unknown function (DUF2946)
MDEIVKAALRKWPHVPNCHGWLGLSARGHWFMRDDPCQAAGPFPQSKGSRIDHGKLLEFIHRNYGADEAGAWFFQNGPQRVYVDLEAAPYVWRLSTTPEPGQWAVQAHTGQAAQVRSSWLDETGRLFLETDLGFGLVHSLDMGLAADAVEAGVWLPQSLQFAEMPQRFGYRLQPRPQPGPASP